LPGLGKLAACETDTYLSGAQLSGHEQSAWKQRFQLAVDGDAGGPLRGRFVTERERMDPDRG